MNIYKLDREKITSKSWPCKAKAKPSNILYIYHLSKNIKPHQPLACKSNELFWPNQQVPFDTWDRTERSGTRRSVPRLVRLKRMEHAVSQDKFWVNFRSASPFRNDSFHICGTQNYNISVSFFLLLVSIRGHLCSLSVPSRPIPLRPVHLHTKRRDETKQSGTRCSVPHGTGRNGMGRDGTGQDRTEQRGSKDALGWKQGGRRRKRRCYNLCSTDVKRVVTGGEAERKFTQNSSRGTVRSTRFRRTKHRTEHLVPLRSVSSHVPNGTYKELSNGD
ncbi:hypothetical protein DVH24_017753 [Malus domestica]|uniref:Uncharacterized protein n=1 Tax=Malus domestica TaxID=3750 RepID=A0A498KEF8_MALDO|nr:hypothetical protein DVH24_017753 [Malus domestica]